ncbi:C2H2-type zinc finger protein [Sansalvadorimonas sp. 2012CJ34-2]|uniref:C2H2-type zinc finger protein n=1 Tax=Parendozoicomonas callyspongiae TaxID=2942213 RepID=A0ABT0PKC9_9GAMM|nr:C2H2-type zinc finger protein [Sansalvadorimonas sp. 2012CJ34-2]MCL6271814.1 C2H2-type zinc finger protein [Sansalvadorimonas sp. 2012CJ34-2]
MNSWRDQTTFISVLLLLILLSTRIEATGTKPGEPSSPKTASQILSKDYSSFIAPPPLCYSISSDEDYFNTVTFPPNLSAFFWLNENVIFFDEKPEENSLEVINSSCSDSMCAVTIQDGAHNSTINAEILAPTPSTATVILDCPVSSKPPIEDADQKNFPAHNREITHCNPMAAIRTAATAVTAAKPETVFFSVSVRSQETKPVRKTADETFFTCQASSDGRYHCKFPGCEKNYGRTGHLKYHTRRHTGERPFVCKWADCEWTFSRSDELKRHIRTHTREKPYKCNKCRKAFSRSDHLSNHKKTHQNNLAPGPSRIKKKKKGGGEKESPLQ